MHFAVVASRSTHLSTASLVVDAYLHSFIDRITLDGIVRVGA